MNDGSWALAGMLICLGVMFGVVIPLAFWYAYFKKP